MSLNVWARFWDWTRPETATEGLPDIFKKETLTLTMPGSQQEEVNNVLFCYRFETKEDLETLSSFKDYRRANYGAQDLRNRLIDETGKDTESTVQSPFSKWRRTYRWPNDEAEVTTETKVTTETRVTKVAKLTKATKEIKETKEIKMSNVFNTIAIQEDYESIDK